MLVDGSGGDDLDEGRVDGQDISPVGYKEGGELRPVTGDWRETGRVRNPLLYHVPLLSVGSSQRPSPEVGGSNVVGVHRRVVSHFPHLFWAVIP